MAKEIDKSGERWLGLLRQNLDLDVDILQTMSLEEVMEDLVAFGVGPEDIRAQTKKVQKLIRTWPNPIVEETQKLGLDDVHVLHQFHVACH